MVFFKQKDRFFVKEWLFFGSFTEAALFFLEKKNHHFLFRTGLNKQFFLFCQSFCLVKLLTVSILST
jgi:hypothetical protein